MKGRTILLLIAALSVFQVLYGQKPDYPFEKRDEVYFSFPLHARLELNSISRQISVDRFSNDTVWAYANRKQFERFAGAGYKITLLPHPGDGPGIEMRDRIPLTRGTLTTWNFYPTYQAYETLMSDFQAMYPSLCHLETITTLPSGHKILVVKISDNVTTDEEEPEFLYTSSIHGDETTGYILMMHLIEYLLQNYGTDQEVTELVNGMEIYINPLANPDGTYRGGDNSVSGATRYNINNVDLNRNYPDPEDGEHPDGEAWQPETIAFMNFAAQHDFVAGANFHGGIEVVNYPWDTWSRRSADDNWWIMISREYADICQANSPTGYMDDLENGITNGYDWYEVAGGRQDYMNYFHHCREFTLEISTTKMVPAAQLPNYWNYNYRSVILFLKQATYGFRGLITDQVTGLPVEAKVLLTGHDTDNTEVYSTVLNGDYYRPVKAGTYTLEVSAPCYETQILPGRTIADYTSSMLNIQLVPGAGVTTAAISSITSTSAESGGEVICTGASPVTARGVCWGTSANPIISGLHTTNGSGTGPFVSTLTGLSPNTGYFVRAYATNAQGTVYGENIQFSSACGSSTIPFTENFNGTTLPNCWLLQSSGNGAVANWSVSNTANAGGTAYEMKSTWQNINPATTRLVTPPFNTSNYTQLELSFRHMFDAYGSGVTLKVQSSTDAVNWTDETWSAAGTSSNIPATMVSTIISNNLNSPTTYLAFTITGNLYQYDYWYIDGVSLSGVSSSLPVVNTSEVTFVTMSTATSGGNVTNSGTSAVTSRGVCWSESVNPTIDGNHTTDGIGTGPFASYLTGLSSSTTYHVRAYATNSAGTSYGNDVTFTTPCEIVSSFPWSESFENGGVIPSCWTQEQVNSSGINWTFISGNGTGYPLSAHSGAFNACLKDNTTADNKTLLITPPLNLSGILSPTLQFWHTQALWSPDQDQLSIYYKISVAGPWILLTTYPSNISTWTAENLSLPDASDNYYIGFEGNAKYGRGVCIDDVSVYGAPGTLSVTPPNQDVGSPAGSVNFDVVSNSEWTAGCAQAWCSITPSGNGNATITAVYEENTSGLPRVATIEVNVPGINPATVTLNQEASTEKVLNLTLLLEGLFNGTAMNKARNGAGDQFPGDTADEITVELHHAYAPYGLAAGPYIVGVNTTGNTQLMIPASLGDSYFIVIKHRNSLETWNNSPVSFDETNISYNFTDAPTRAYGSNLKQISDRFVIYGGDVNQDGQVDSADMTPVDNDASGFVTGYLNSDTNGDGIVDTADMTILDNNSSMFIRIIAP